MTLPDDVQEAVGPLMETLPEDQAMTQLVVTQRAPANLARVVDHIVKHPVIAKRPRLQAGLWLYVDELERSHAISQSMNDATGAFWHGIMHRREGDFSNSHYWFRRVGHHPVTLLIPGYDGHGFIDEVEARGEGDAALIAMQRLEWETLFEWCATS